jgi:hypothetical protein
MPLRYSWEKRRPIRKGSAEDRAEAEAIARQVVDDPDHQQELRDWLLAKPSRLRQLQRNREAAQRADEFELRGKAFTMNRSETLRSIVKQAGGVVSLAKRIVRDGTSEGITEHELTQLVVDAAKRAHPDLDDSRAFTKMFTDTSPAGEALRRAVNVAKQTAGQLDAPAAYQVGGDDARDVNDPQAALDELKELIAEMRGRVRNLSESDAWNRVVRENPALAKRAIPRLAPVTSYAFPRT